MNLHDDLPGLLDAEVSDVTLSPDLWDRVRTGVDRRRRRTAWLRGALALTALAGLALVAVVIVPRDPAADTAPAVTPTPTAVEPADEIQGVWPFRTQAQIRDYQAKPTRVEFQDPLRTAQLFVTEFLSLTGAQVTRISPSGFGYAVHLAGKEITQLDLAEVPGSTGQPTVYVVSHAGSAVYPLSVDVTPTQPLRASQWVGGSLPHEQGLSVTVRVDVEPQAEHSAPTPATIDGGRWLVQLDAQPASARAFGSVTAYVRDAQSSIQALSVRPAVFTNEKLPARDMSWLKPEVPREFVAVAPDGAVVVVNARSGERGRVLAQPPTHQSIESLAMDETGASVVYGTTDSRCAGSIYRVATDGSAEARVILAGEARVKLADPVLSPDGSRVAFTRATCKDAGRGPSTSELVVRHLSTGEERRWPATPDPADGGTDTVSKPAWDSSGDYIAVLHHACCGDDDPTIRKVDVLSPGPVNGLPTVTGPPDRSPPQPVRGACRLAPLETTLVVVGCDGSLTSVTWLNDGTTELLSYQDLPWPITAAAFEPQGNFLLVTHEERSVPRVYVWQRLSRTQVELGEALRLATW